MNEMDDLGLHDLLHLATDEVGSPALAAPALRTARRRRTRRRGAAAAVLSSAVVVTVVVATHLGGGTSVAPAPTNPSAPTSLPAPDDPRPVTQPTWDPDLAPDLPPAPPELAPALPDVVDPPASSPLLTDAPVEAAVAVTETDGVAQLLSIDGEWRSVPLAHRYPRLELSPDGTRLAASYAGGDEGATVVDLATGASRVLPFPTDFHPFDFTYWTFVDEDTLFLHGGSGTSYLVDAADGAAGAVDHDADGFDGAGVALQSDCCVGPRVLIDWADGTPRKVPLGELGRLSNLTADAATVVANSDLGVTVADRQTLAPLVALPTRPRTGIYGDGGEPFVMALTDDGTVLLRVLDYRDADGAIRPEEAEVRVVAWEPDTGALSLVSTGPTGVSYAQGLLRAVSDPAAEGTTDDIVAAPSIDPTTVHDLWDPETVTGLPRATSTTLPASLVAPPGARPLDEFPIQAAVAAVQTDDGVDLVDAGGSWRSVELPEAPVDLAFVPDLVALSSDGTVLVFAGTSRLWHVTTAEGAWRSVPYPDEMAQGAEVDLHLALAGPDRLLVSGYADGEATWSVDLGTGEATRTPYLLGASGVDGDHVAEVGVRRGHRYVDAWDGTTRTGTLEIDGFESLLFPSLRRTSVAAAREVGGWTTPRAGAEWDGLLVFDTIDGASRGYLPVRDDDGWYARYGLVPVGWVDDDVVLARVVPKSTRGVESATAHLVSWEVATGELAWVSSYDVDTHVALAADLIGDAGP